MPWGAGDLPPKFKMAAEGFSHPAKDAIFWNQNHMIPGIQVFLFSESSTHWWWFQMTSIRFSFHFFLASKVESLLFWRKSSNASLNVNAPFCFRWIPWSFCFLGMYRHDSHSTWKTQTELFEQPKLLFFPGIARLETARWFHLSSSTGIYVHFTQRIEENMDFWWFFGYLVPGPHRRCLRGKRHRPFVAKIQAF